jgi:hypothetical protein
VACEPEIGRRTGIQGRVLELWNTGRADSFSEAITTSTFEPHPGHAGEGGRGLTTSS